MPQGLPDDVGHCDAVALGTAGEPLLELGVGADRFHRGWSHLEPRPTTLASAGDNTRMPAGAHTGSQQHQRQRPPASDLLAAEEVLHPDFIAPAVEHDARVERWIHDRHLVCSGSIVTEVDDDAQIVDALAG
jgi:hypothetical protein